MKLYHGTTAKGYNNIINNTQCKPVNPWYCSEDDDLMYFWSYDEITAEYNYNNEIDHESTHETCLQYGFEAGQVQALMTDDTELYVIEVDVPDELVMLDESCDNMQYARCINISDFNINYIKKTFVCNFNIWHKPFILASVMQNPNFNNYNIDSALLEVADSVQNTHIDAVHEFDYTELS